MGFSQLKPANLVDSAPNYIAMIEAGKRFSTDTMLEKIAVALRREPCELFSATPIQKHWEENLLADFAEFIALKQKDQKKEPLLHLAISDNLAQPPEKKPKKIG
ncbi:MAG: helix-turn-helix domain-containing protein [Treponema sp.]|jgi:transcriptional regulator with XRE-family HTH domain|nr:helix-turn-helix domain-containing protein [Treponema sp.]